MNDFDLIIKNIERFIILTDDEKEIFFSYLHVIKVKKKQFIVQPNFVCQNRSYIVTGSFQTYLLDKDGQEHVIGLSVEDWWVGDFESYITQQPATMFVEALENSTIIQLTYENEQKIYKQIPKFEHFFRRQVEQGTLALRMRLRWALSSTAEERYEEFIQRYPHFIQRFPQYIIASYLGMTTQFLSKIRNKKGKS